MLHQILHLPPVGGEAFGQQIRIDGIRHVGGYIARGVRVLSLVFVYFAKVEGKKEIRKLREFLSVEELKLCKL